MKEATDFTLFPTVRQGYRPDAAFSTDGSISGSGTADLTLSVEGEGPEGTTTEAVEMELDVYGPGEVTALDTDQIVRMEPEPATTEFPPNYFPLVEFDSPQLPWLFSPERADGQGRNRPWLCLVVVPRGATTIEPPGTGALSVLETPVEELPDPAETWAWAHAQLVGEAEYESEFSSSSTKTVSRLVCPRNLDPETQYRACIVPTFEPGRRAGLGLDPSPGDDTNTEFAWGETESVKLPVYHHWEFTSAPKGDFESLARELEPRTFEGDVGFRTIDVSNPGPQRLKPESGAGSDVGTVGIGGALKAIGVDPDGYHSSLVPELRELLNKPDTVEMETDYGAVGPPLYGQWHAGVPRLEDESLDSPLYYYPHWFNTLNADPRHRIAAGYGTQVIQHNQEGLMESAWDQFGEIQEANRFLNRAQLAIEVQNRRHQTLETVSTGTLMGLTAPVHATMLNEESGETVLKMTEDSDLPSALSSSSFRRISRPGGPLARRSGVSIDTSKLVTRLETGRIPRVTDGLDVTVETAPGADAETTEEQRAGAPPAGGVPELETIGSDVADMETIGSEFGDEQFPEGGAGEQPFGGPPTEGAQGRAGPAEEPDRHPGIERVEALLDSIDGHADAADRDLSALSTAMSRGDESAIADAIDRSPTLQKRCEVIGPDTFGPLTRTLSKLLAVEPDSLPAGFDRATAGTHLQSLHAAQRDLDEAVEETVQQLRTDGTQRAVDRGIDRAKRALDRLRSTAGAIRSGLAPPSPAMQALSMEVEGDADPAELGIDGTDLPDVGSPAPAEVDLPSKEAIRETITRDIDPSIRIPEFAGNVLGIPDLPGREDPVESVMAAPTFSDFTYELLAELNQEYFLPGAGDIPKNSIGVLQTNPEFVEAFLAGLNHEMSRELRWRRYPSDRRGTYFRRFWDRRGNPDVDTDDPEQMADIEPMHTWDQNDLGENSPRDDDAKVVLLIKGELLRRYPNTDVFAAKAVGDGDVGEDEDRVPALPDTHVSRELAEGDIDDPDVEADHLLYPVFRGTLEPDITFFGFDLTPDEALYDPYHQGPQEPDDHADEGWFFVLQEPPGETRFGLDVGDEADVGETPAGITHDGTTEQVSEAETEGAFEHGLNAISWAHLVDEGESPSGVKYVDVADSRPGDENWAVEDGSSYVSDSTDDDYAYDPIDAATWGYNSAHMARTTWQLPVRISIHADDMITERTADSWRVEFVQEYQTRYLDVDGDPGDGQ